MNQIVHFLFVIYWLSTILGCIMYYFDTANSNCYSGVLTYTSGSWGLTGSITAKFNQGMYISKQI